MPGMTVFRNFEASYASYALLRQNRLLSNYKTLAASI